MTRKGNMLGNQDFPTGSVATSVDINHEISLSVKRLECNHEQFTSYMLYNLSYLYFFRFTNILMQ